MNALPEERWPLAVLSITDLEAHLSLPAITVMEMVNTAASLVILWLSPSKTAIVEASLLLDNSQEQDCLQPAAAFTCKRIVENQTRIQSASCLVPSLQ